MQIELNHSMVDQIVQQVIAGQIKSLQEEINHLEEQEDLASYQEQDLLDCYRNLKALDRTLKYFCNPDEYKRLTQ